LQARTDEAREKKDNPNKAEKLTQLAEQCRVALNIAGWLGDVYIIFKNKKDNAEKPKSKEAADIWEELDLNWHIMKDEPPEDIQKGLENIYDFLTKELELEDKREEGKTKI
jgi:hypothetical protein